MFVHETVPGQWAEIVTVCLLDPRPPNIVFVAFSETFIYVQNSNATTIDLYNYNIELWCVHVIVVSYKIDSTQLLFYWNSKGFLWQFISEFFYLYLLSLITLRPNMKAALIYLHVYATLTYTGTRFITS